MQDTSNFTFFSVVVFCIVLLTLYRSRATKKELQRLRADIDAKTQMLESEPIDRQVEQLKAETESLSEKVTNGQVVFKQLETSLTPVKKQLTYIEVGLHPPAYQFDDSESLKLKIAKSQEKQYDLIRQRKATTANSNWSWFGSESDGRKMVTSYQSLLLKAFNAEFDFIRKQMRHSSYDTALNKLYRLEEQLEKLGETANVAIDHAYLEEKENELSIWHAELVHREELKQERKKQQALLREQKKAAGNSADADELEDDIYYKKADLKKAQKLAVELHGASANDMSDKIAKMQKEIDKLEEKFERATSQAQITKAGYIYVISNIGSFGEGVVKIGMTRRLEPMDRVNELGDASVPFKFDVHTLTFVNNAPEVEKMLHRKFNDERVNTDNHRKEFFRTSPQAVAEAMEEMGIECDWYYDIEAREYRESLLIRETMKQNSEEVKAKSVSNQLPDSI